MDRRTNAAYYRSIIRLAQQYAPNATSVLDVGAPWPFVTAFRCEMYSNQRLYFIKYKFCVGAWSNTSPLHLSCIPSAGIPRKVMLNDRYPDGIVAPEGISMVEMDFFEYDPEEKFDLVLCNQVIEHVPDPGRFAKKLLATGKVVVASVPYLWGPAAATGHVNHNIDQDTLVQW